MWDMWWLYCLNKYNKYNGNWHKLHWTHYHSNEGHKNNCLCLLCGDLLLNSQYIEKNLVLYMIDNCNGILDMSNLIHHHNIPLDCIYNCLHSKFCYEKRNSHHINNLHLNICNKLHHMFDTYDLYPHIEKSMRCM